MVIFGWGYTPWLVAVSLFWVLAERLRPERRAQSILRPQLGNDLFYLAFNGVWYGTLMYWLGWVPRLAEGVRSTLSFLPAEGWLNGKHVLVQVLVFLVVSDFLQWCVHNLLHRVPWLWQFHKLHHSIHELDWIGHFRFHWVETVVYRSLTFAPLLWLGGDYEPLLFTWVLATCWGHFNHANLDVGIGPLGYVFNSPRMHAWHHDASDEGGVAKNFGLTLSLWDHLFGTAYWPRDRAPERLGYPGDEDMPSSLARQLAFPLTRARGS